MKFSRRIWAGAGLAVGALGVAVALAPTKLEAAEQPATHNEPMFPGSTGKMDVPFSKAMAKMLAGEGGEGGIGFAMAGPSFNAPALTDEQLKMALPGHTIRKDQAAAFYFGADGTMEGWKRDWSDADMSKCPSIIGDNHQIEDGKCYTAVTNNIKGNYTIRDGKVCMPAYSGKPADGEGCYYVGFVTRFVMIGDGQRTYGSGKDYVAGKKLEAMTKEFAAAEIAEEEAKQKAKAKK